MLRAAPTTDFGAQESVVDKLYRIECRPGKLWSGRTWRHNWICISGQAESWRARDAQVLLSLCSGSAQALLRHAHTRLRIKQLQLTSGE